MAGNIIGYIKGTSKFGTNGYKPGGMISKMNSSNSKVKGKKLKTNAQKGASSK